MHRAIGIRWMRHIGSTTPQVSMTYRWVSIVATLPLFHPSATIEGIWRGKQVTRKDRGTRRTIDMISWYRVKSRAAAIVDVSSRVFWEERGVEKVWFPSGKSSKGASMVWRWERGGKMVEEKIEICLFYDMRTRREG